MENTCVLECAERSDQKQKCADQNILMPGCLCVYENIDTLYDVIVIHIKRMVTSCEKINLR
jgi:hypothetical protein